MKHGFAMDGFPDVYPEILERYHGVDGDQIHCAPSQMGAGYPSDESGDESGHLDVSSKNTLVSGDSDCEEHEDDKLQKQIISDIHVNIHHKLVKAPQSQTNLIPSGFGVKPSEWEDGEYPAYEHTMFGCHKKEITVDTPVAIWLPHAIAWCQALLMPPKPAKCTYTSIDDELHCHCPIFVPHPNPSKDKANLCDGCRHTIAFHIDLAEPSSSNTSTKLEEILASYSMQAASFSRASESDACKEVMASLKQSYESDNDFKGKAPKGKKKRKTALKETNKAFTEIRLVAVLPHGLDADGSLNHTVEPLLLQIDKLVDLGFAKIGGRGDLKFENDWNTQMIDDWLQEMLPIVFENIKAIPSVFEDEYPWWLLRTSRSHLELHREKPDGYDAISAKGKSKGWQDSKLFFGTLCHH
ncbi:hypothetical protein K439DRAFT_1619442 [Ramaria rubella]|nr:hypothetical protein K439DRAFT_1619442 [Ramaria rubella]